MGNPFFSTVEILVLVTALSVDAFVASFAYGTNRIKIPLRSVAVISIICSAIFAVSLFLGSLIRPFMPTHFAGLLCFAILFVLGIVKLCDSAIKSFIRRSQGGHKKISFSECICVSYWMYMPIRKMRTATAPKVCPQKKQRLWQLHCLSTGWR